MNAPGRPLFPLLAALAALAITGPLRADPPAAPAPLSQKAIPARYLPATVVYLYQPAAVPAYSVGDVPPSPTWPPPAPARPSAGPTDRLARLELSPAPLPDGAVERPPANLELTAPTESDPLEAPPTVSQVRAVATYGTLQWGIQYTVLILSAPENWQQYGNTLTPSWDKFRSNFDRLPVFEPVELGGGGFLGVLQADGDPWTTNVVGHGLQGSEIYLRMRRTGFGIWESFAGGVAHSTLWEYAIEGWNETPSTIDLVYTPLGGALLGELRFQLVRTLDRQPKRWWIVPLRFVVDPVATVVEAID